MKKLMILDLFGYKDPNKIDEEQELRDAARGDIGGSASYMAVPAYTKTATRTETPKTTELTAPEYVYTAGQFGYGPFSYGDYAYKDQALLDAAKQKVANFSYDPESDVSYKAYARQYMRNGEDALRNTMARLASRTGGVASSYAVQAAQGAYNNYMQQLADKVPELSELAFQRVQDQYNLYNNEYNRDLAKWQADKDFEYQKYLADRDIAFKNFQLEEAARQKTYDSKYNADVAKYESYKESLQPREDESATAYKARLEKAVDDKKLTGDEAWKYWEAFNDENAFANQSEAAAEEARKTTMNDLRQTIDKYINVDKKKDAEKIITDKYLKGEIGKEDYDLLKKYLAFMGIKTWF